MIEDASVLRIRHVVPLVPGVMLPRGGIREVGEIAVAIIVHKISILGIKRCFCWGL